MPRWTWISAKDAIGNIRQEVELLGRTLSLSSIVLFRDNLQSAAVVCANNNFGGGCLYNKKNN